jgi:RluA family pseudouridine synthase
MAAPPVPIVHDDDDLLAVAKPPDLPVIPARTGPPEACLWRALEATLGKRLWVVHRIDRDTSGLVVFAKHADAHRALSMAFEARDVRKTYLAFAAGALPAARRVDLALHDARKGKTRPALPGEAGARAAVTELAARRVWLLGGAAAPAPSAVTLVEARPETGRHHQIRVHLRALDAPIVADPLYGKHTLEGALAAAPCRRLALHAWRLTLPPLRGGAPLALESPLAPDLQALERWLDATFAAEAAQP